MSTGPTNELVYTMEHDNLLPLKRVELSLSKFNDVAIPHHLELLRQHKANIIKYEEAGEFVRVRGEAAGAARVAARLRALLGEMASLRARVAPADRAVFDARTQRARDLTLAAIMDYLESSPMSMTRARDEVPPACGSAVSTDSVGVVAHARARAAGAAARAGAGAGADAGAGAGAGADGDDCDVPVLQLQIDDRELALSEREAALRGWTALQGELRALHGAWAATHAAALAQRATVRHADARVEAAAGAVGEARRALSAAEKLRAGAYGAGGALLGACAGGPVGLVVGAKAGAAAALAGSLLGLLGARLLGARRQAQLALPAPAPAPDTPAPDTPAETLARRHEKTQ